MLNTFTTIHQTSWAVPEVELLKILRGLRVWGVMKSEVCGLGFRV